MRLLTIAAAALAALLLTIALANAQEPPESQTTTRLEPGINLVGWTGEPTSVSQLFREIPQLEAIWAWDAELDDWIVAGRDAPEWLGGLGRVRAGMGLRLILGGEELFLWQRSTEPTRGLVELRTGWNLVAWSGADDAPLEQVAKGIGWSLRELRRWNAANQQWTTWTSPERSTQLIATSATDQGATGEEAEPVTVRRGEALWVNVARSVNWLQPTDILPRLVFPGGASDELQTRVREDLESVLAFFGQRYGIQSDPTDFTIYIPKDVEALLQAYRDDGDEISDASIRALWNLHDGWGGEEIMVKQTLWPEDLSTSEIARARYTLTHEYFHVLQDQLSHLRASEWLVEGTATWGDDEHSALDGEHTLEDLREGRQSRLSPRTPTLRSAERRNAQWQYTLGWLATDRLIAAAGDGSHIEFWRRLAPTEIGPHSRWTSTPDWRTAFQETFGLPVSSFYADFDAWQRQQAMVHGSVASASDGDTRWIRGRVTDASGVPAAGVFVNAVLVEGDVRVGWNQRAETNTGGVFAVRAPEDGDYRLSVDIDDDCATRYYYSNGRLLDERNAYNAHPVKVAGSDLRNIDIQLPPNVCSWFIRGRVTTDAGQPLADVSVSACADVYGPHGSPVCTSGHTAPDGSFAVPAAAIGENRLHLDLAGDCRAYYHTSGVATAKRGKASPISIIEADSLRLQIRVPEGMCAYRIKGTIAKSDGQPLTDVSIAACREDASCVEQDTDAAGSFTITVPTEGRYRLNFRLGGCMVYLGQSPLTSNRNVAWLAVEGRDLQLGQRQVPAGWCSQQISGRLVSADGEPLARVQIEICQPAGYDGCATYRSGTTDANGAFAVTVPVAGEYRLSFEFWSIRVCRFYFGTNGLTDDQRQRSNVHVDRGGAHLGLLELPAGMCGYRISGRFVDANGAPLAEKRIQAKYSYGSSIWAQTDANGRFGIRVPSDGVYHFTIQIQSESNCWQNPEDRALGSRDNPVRVDGADVTGITLRLPGTVEELCG